MNIQYFILNHESGLSNLGMPFGHKEGNGLMSRESEKEGFHRIIINVSNCYDY